MASRRCPAAESSLIAGHEIIVVKWSSSLIAVFATITPAGNSPPVPFARMNMRVFGSAKTIGPYSGTPHSLPPSSSDASRASAKTRFARSTGIGLTTAAASSRAAIMPLVTDKDAATSPRHDLRPRVSRRAADLVDHADRQGALARIDPDGRGERHRLRAYQRLSGRGDLQVARTSHDLGGFAVTLADRKVQRDRPHQILVLRKERDR